MLSANEFLYIIVIDCIVFLFYLFTHTLPHEIAHCVVAKKINPSCSASVHIKWIKTEFEVKNIVFSPKYDDEKNVKGYSIIKGMENCSLKEIRKIAMAGPICNVLYGSVLFTLFSIWNFRILWGIPFLLFFEVIRFFCSDTEWSDYEIIKNPEGYKKVSP